MPKRTTVEMLCSHRQDDSRLDRGCQALFDNAQKKKPGCLRSWLSHHSIANCFIQISSLELANPKINSRALALLASFGGRSKVQ